MLPQSKPPPQTPPGTHYCRCSIHFRPQESSLSWQHHCPYGQSETESLFIRKPKHPRPFLPQSVHHPVIARQAPLAVAISYRLVAVSIEPPCHCELRSGVAISCRLVPASVGADAHIGPMEAVPNLLKFVANRVEFTAGRCGHRPLRFR